MEDRHRTILRDHRPNIVRDLEPNNILPDLGSVLTEKDDAEIKAQSTRQGRCEQLLEIIPRKGPNAFKVFVEALKKEAPHLASDLIDADHEGTDKELRQVREQSANLRREYCELKKKLEAEEQDHTKTSLELKELKSLHETFKTKTSQQIRTLAKPVQRLTTGDSSSSCKALGNWRDSTKSETLTLGMEIEELTKTITQMIVGYQAKIEAQRKSCQSSQEHEELSKELKAANENHQREIEDLRMKNNESQEEVLKLENELEKSRRDLEKIEKDLANERDRVKDYQQIMEVARKAADDPLKLRPKNEEQQAPKENKSHRKKPSEERWKRSPLKKGVHRLGLTSKPQMPGADDSCSPCEALRNLRDSTERETQTSEIQELTKGITKMVEGYRSLQIEHGNLSQELEKAKKLLEDHDNSKEEALILKKKLEKSQRDLANKNERVKEYQEKLQAKSKTIDDLRIRS